MSTGSKKHKQIKKKTPDRQLNSEKPVFCTECNTDLDAFWLNSLANDPENVRRIHENCKRIGRFNGEQCSKLFIIDLPDTDSIFDKWD
jgi:hypothetical protein